RVARPSEAVLPRRDDWRDGPGEGLMLATKATAQEHKQPEAVFVEPRWPIAIALSAYIAITIALRLLEPHREALGPKWLVPGIEIGLLAALIAADPANISRRSKWLRRVSITLIFLLAAATFL